MATHIPFLGRLSLSRGVPWKKAALETAISILLSSAPVWIAVLALLFVRAESTFFGATSAVVSNGELYLLAAGAASPLFYITIIQYRRQEGRDSSVTSFPHGGWYTLSALVVLAVSIIYITIRSIFDRADLNSSSYELELFVDWSWSLYFFSIFLFFTASVHKNILEDTNASILREEEQAFASQWMLQQAAEPDLPDEIGAGNGDHHA